VQNSVTAPGTSPSISGSAERRFTGTSRKSRLRSDPGGGPEATVEIFTLDLFGDYIPEEQGGAANNLPSDPPRRRPPRRRLTRQDRRTNQSRRGKKQTSRPHPRAALTTTTSVNEQPKQIGQESTGAEQGHRSEGFSCSEAQPIAPTQPQLRHHQARHAKLRGPDGRLPDSACAVAR
jgi:hypothetical protein